MTANCGQAQRTDRSNISAAPWFHASAVLVFAAGIAATVYFCRSMSGGMAVPGGWTMSMMWMRMPGQSWPGAAAMFMAMWVAMMAAMMMPSLLPMLINYRQCAGAPSDARLGGLTAIVGAGYFFVWAVFGAIAYPIGVGLAEMEMRSPALARRVPLATGVVLVLMGCVQFTAWKARHLGCCREAKICSGSPAPDARSAWRHGIQLGVHCSLCCIGLMIILLVTNVMDLGIMAVVTIAITVERLLPKPRAAACVTGFFAVAAGVLAIARAMYPG